MVALDTVLHPSAMVGDDDAVDPGIARELGVLMGENALEQQLAFHDVAQPLDASPRSNW